MIKAPIADGPLKGQIHEFRDFRVHEIEGIEYRLATYAFGIEIGSTFVRCYLDAGFHGKPPDNVPQDLDLSYTRIELGGKAESLRELLSIVGGGGVIRRVIRRIKTDQPQTLLTTSDKIVEARMLANLSVDELKHERVAELKAQRKSQIRKGL